MSQGQPRKRKPLTARLGWTRTSYVLLSGFLLVILLIIYFWYPLAEEYLALIDWQGAWWRTLDWLLIGIFLAMTLLIMYRADLRRDGWILFVGTMGGLVIESWGTQTEIWTYYTAERPPLWIIPAWPIATLSIDRITHMLGRYLPQEKPRLYRRLYWLIFPAFFMLMFVFVMPTLDKSLTLMALFLVAFLILTPTDERTAVLTFLAGSGLGYFLERWGTTRLCWTYYTHQTPPLFAVLAHGMAAVAFWRSVRALQFVLEPLRVRIGQWLSREESEQSVGD